MKYEFHVGDYVETSSGHEGYILKYDCFSDKFPVTWGLTVYHKEYGHSTVYEVHENCFPAFFNRIGQYDFTKKDEDEIEPLCEEYTKSFPICKTITTGNDSEWRSIDIGAVSKKINELVEAVNSIKKEINNG